MAVAVADGASTISDVAVLADQAALFGAVASDSTCWRLLDQLDRPWLGAVASARAAAREVVWAQRGELTGAPFPPAHAAGQELPGLVIDLDASVVVCHSEKELAAPTFKRSFGYHPMLAFCDNTGEFLAATLRRGNAGSNTAADHIEVLDAAVRSCPKHRHGTPILIRADTAGCTRGFLAHVRRLREDAVSCEFSVGWAITSTERAAIGAIPKMVWADAIDADGGRRDGAGLAEITHVLPARALTGYPSGIRSGERERRARGAELDAFEESTDGATPLRHRHRCGTRPLDARTARTPSRGARHRSRTPASTTRPARSRSTKHGCARDAAVDDRLGPSPPAAARRCEGRTEAPLPAAARRSAVGPVDAAALATHPVGMGARPRRARRLATLPVPTG